MRTYAHLCILVHTHAYSENNDEDDDDEKDDGTATTTIFCTNDLVNTLVLL